MADATRPSALTAEGPTDAHFVERRPSFLGSEKSSGQTLRGRTEKWSRLR
jgi:hypothetical protein